MGAEALETGYGVVSGGHVGGKYNKEGLWLVTGAVYAYHVYKGQHSRVHIERIEWDTVRANVSGVTLPVYTEYRPISRNHSQDFRVLSLCLA